MILKMNGQESFHSRRDDVISLIFVYTSKGPCNTSSMEPKTFSIRGKLHYFYFSFIANPKKFSNLKKNKCTRDLNSLTQKKSSIYTEISLQKLCPQ